MLRNRIVIGKSRELNSFPHHLLVLSFKDEYTRITTPRQDVLFKKGYLSRMNNKTANNLSATVNSSESTAASSTITTSDPDSSVSTLSPATTPSMDYGQADSMDFGQMYYPGYYDENGMLVIRKHFLMQPTMFITLMFITSQRCTITTTTILKTDRRQRRQSIWCLILISTIHSSWPPEAYSRLMPRRVPKTRRKLMAPKKTINMQRTRMWVLLLSK